MFLLMRRRGTAREGHTRQWFSNHHLEGWSKHRLLRASPHSDWCTQPGVRMCISDKFPADLLLLILNPL